MRTRRSVASAARARANEVVGEDSAETKEEKPEKPSPPPKEEKTKRTRSQKKAKDDPGMQALEDEAEDAKDRKEQAERSRRKTATADPSELSMGEGYDRIVESIFDLPDPHEEYLAVKQSLSLGTRASRADYGTLVDALDRAEEMAERAYKLFVNAKVARDSYDIDAQAIEAGMREEAMKVLMQEYARKERRSPTEADVTSYMAAKFPDEWRDIQNRRGRARRTCSYLEQLSNRASERCRDLRQMVAKSRGD